MQLIRFRPIFPCLRTIRNVWGYGWLIQHCGQEECRIKHFGGGRQHTSQPFILLSTRKGYVKHSSWKWVLVRTRLSGPMCCQFLVMTHFQLESITYMMTFLLEVDGLWFSSKFLSHKYLMVGPYILYSNHLSIDLIKVGMKYGSDCAILMWGPLLFPW